MTRSELATAFWVDDINGRCLKVQCRDGEIETRDGFRFQWVRNELGSLYLKSLGQIGYEQSPRYTVQEYARQTRAMAEAHVQALSPEIRGAIGSEIIVSQQMEMNMPVPFDNSDAGGAVFL